MKNRAGIAVMALCLAVAASAQAAQSLEPLQSQLDQLPLLDAAQPKATEADLRYNTQDAARVPVRRTEDEPNPFTLEEALMDARIPAVASSETVSSLSHRVRQSPLSACSQLCSFPMALKNGVKSNLMQFTCGEGRMVRLREYPDPDEGEAFALARERVNVMVGGRPAYLQRLQKDAGQGMTLLAWRGRHQGYSLMLPDSSDASARQAMEYAESLP